MENFDHIRQFIIFDSCILVHGAAKPPEEFHFLNLNFHLQKKLISIPQTLVCCFQQARCRDPTQAARFWRLFETSINDITWSNTI